MASVASNLMTIIASAVRLSKRSWARRTERSLAPRLEGRPLRIDSDVPSGRTTQSVRPQKQTQTPRPPTPQRVVKPDETNAHGVRLVKFRPRRICSFHEPFELQRRSMTLPSQSN